MIRSPSRFRRCARRTSGYRSSLIVSMTPTTKHLHPTSPLHTRLPFILVNVPSLLISYDWNDSSVWQKGFAADWLHQSTLGTALFVQMQHSNPRLDIAYTKHVLPAPHPPPPPPPAPLSLQMSVLYLCLNSPAGKKLNILQAVQMIQYEY